MHDNKDITNICKQASLNGQIFDESQKLTEGFKLEYSGYQPTIDLLKGTCVQLERLKAAQISKLCELLTRTYQVSEIEFSRFIRKPTAINR